MRSHSHFEIEICVVYAMIHSKYRFVPWLALYFISYGLFYHSGNLKCATHWHLHEQNGVMQVVPVKGKLNGLFESDPLFYLLVKANPPKNRNSLVNRSKDYQAAVAGVR